MVVVICWISRKTGGELTVSGYLVFLLVSFGDEVAVAMDSQRHASSHLSVFENTLARV